MSKKKELCEQVKKLIEINKSQPLQRSDLWYSMRKNRITASDLGSIIPAKYEFMEHYMKEFKLFGNLENITHGSKYINPYSSEKEFILKKNGINDTFTGNAATNHGQRYEETAIMFYEQRKLNTVLEFGLIPHETIEIFGASPDGITPDGIMIEIKCPMMRKLKGITPIYYWFQVQLQLAVCNLDKCHFLEMTINEITKDEFLIDDIPEVTFIHKLGKKETKNIPYAKGLLIDFDDRKQHLYYPKRFYNKNYDRKKMLEWAEKKVLKYKNLNPKIIFYQIKEYSIMTIMRNKELIQRILPVCYDTWKKVKNFNKKEYLNEQNIEVLELDDSDDDINECIL